MTITPEEAKFIIDLINGEPVECYEAGMIGRLEERLQRGLNTVKDSDELLVEFSIHVSEEQDRSFTARARRAAQETFEAVRRRDTTATVFQVSDVDQAIKVDLLDEPYL